MDTLAERLKFRRSQLGLSQTAVARSVSKLRGRAFSQQAYAALESGSAQMSTEIAAIAEVLGAPLTWIRDGLGETPLPRPPGGHEFTVDADIDRLRWENAILEVNVRAGAGGRGVPFEVCVSEGNSISTHAEGIRDRWLIPPFIVQEMMHAAPGHLRVFEVIGDSMEPQLQEGDRAFIDVRYRVPSPEGIFALWNGLGVVIKRLQVVRGTDPLKLRIISANPQYAPYEATLAEVRIIGRYAGRFTVN